VVVAHHRLAGLRRQHLDLVEGEEEGRDAGEEELVAGVVLVLLERHAARQLGREVGADGGDDAQPQRALRQELVGVVDALARARDHELVVGAGEDARRADLDLTLAVGVDDDAVLLLTEHHGAPHEARGAGLLLEGLAHRGGGEDLGELLRGR
jgi:hypothetical protein